MREHELSPSCWCEPRQDDEEQALWIHNEVAMTTETPRTDSAAAKLEAAWDFARFLEQENAQMRAALERLCNAKGALYWSPTTEIVEAFAHARNLLLKLDGYED